MNAITRTLAELDPQADAATQITAQDEELLRAIMATPHSPVIELAEVTPRRHVRRTLIVAGAVAATVALGLTRIDLGGHDVAGSPAAAVLEHAADVTIKASDPVVGPGQYLRISTVQEGWTYRGYFYPEGEAPDKVTVDVGDDGRPQFFKVRSVDRTFIPYDHDQGTWVFTQDSTIVQHMSSDHTPYDDGPSHEAWTSKGGATSKIREYSKYLDADWYASLPRDPDALLKELLKDAHHYAPIEHYVALEEAAAPVLTSGVAPADIRAALFRALAKEPKVRISDDAPVLDGRQTFALHIGYSDLLFDKETAQYAGRQEIPDPADGEPRVPGLGPHEPQSVTTFHVDVVDTAPGQD
ncbi:hypothetical protein ASE12_15255 [Aeromicrobium sp. Root236]|uniref:hypothetical protein n=1 Tax=Aeromicrobium sp. Root236 TaxID=1736498 RepID=UPI0006F54B78|nr:hypothetical protein [Aeromicrobium sp. Root236]KRC65994.1 hypothetical protein ASE12_15255 [Aeromicrobium sp. Root236]